MSSPIHTIHGTFSGISTCSSRPYSTYAGVVMNMADGQSPGLARGGLRVLPIPPSCRRLSSSPDARRHTPARATTAQYVIQFPQEDSDPFDDRYALPAPTGQVVPYQRTRLASQSFTIKLPRSSHLEALMRQRTAQRLAQDREARCKAVAGILLNRVHAVGRPMRRVPPNLDVPRTYKRSRLSTMLSVDDLS